ncbi:MAG TPA: sensor domain-containing diguanylate cyclase [Solirubrobacteraceae bacterium]
MDRDRTATFKALGPFVGAASLAWIVVLVGSRINWPQYSAASAMAIVALGLTMLTARGGRWARDGIVPGGVAFLVAVAMLRNSAGGISSGAGGLAIIPVFHIALYSRRRRDLGLILAGVAVFYIAPILVVGSPFYPHSQYRSALLAVTVYTIIGFATQQLVERVRRQASDAREREHVLERLGDVVRGLFDSPQPRIDVCEAAKSISGATVALLYEPAPGACTELFCTAVSGIDVGISREIAAQESAVPEVFRSGRPLLLTDDFEARVGNRALWIASGRPRSVLYQPLMRNGMAIGVLVVAWPDRVPSAGAQSTATLLAHEAAAAIARADAMDSLAGEAQTDPLTGLPNRRAWDAALANALAEDALAEDGSLAIAMLDLDHFKAFNDAHGHPAGDRLLKETAAAWRGMLRGGDLVARLGGEEFGLLLRDCDGDIAAEVTERVRCCVPRGGTCSAGIVIAAPGESADVVVARADAALYEAKSRGRDRIHLTASV